MTDEELQNAMRYGSQNSLDERRKDDLGRFGLGLKMASITQCRKVTVITKKDNKINGACWDLDFIINKGNWILKYYDEENISALSAYQLLIKQNSALLNQSSGTVVIWENFDRLKNGSSQAEKAFDEKIELSRKHISLVFHRFLNDENIKSRINIYFNNERVNGVDPFLTKHPATQPLSEQILRIDGKKITVKPYVLPYLNKLTKKDIEEIGGKEELRQQQGFYIYRNRRLIVWGTWFRLIKQSELGKLARIRVDIPNSLDSIWEIDIKKSSASLPHIIKKNLVDIVQKAVGRSDNVYKYRGRKICNDDLIHVWEPIDERGKLQYIVNKDLPIIKMLNKHLDEEGESLLDSFIKMIEDAFPFADVYYRMAKADANVTEATMENNDVFEIAKQMVQQVSSMGGDVKAFLASLDKMDFFIKYPDVVRQIREVYEND
jgi:hypothetical protein